MWSFVHHGWTMHKIRKNQCCKPYASDTGGRDIESRLRLGSGLVRGELGETVVYTDFRWEKSLTVFKDSLLSFPTGSKPLLCSHWPRMDSCQVLLSRVSFMFSISLVLIGNKYITDRCVFLKNGIFIVVLSCAVTVFPAKFVPVQ